MAEPEARRLAEERRDRRAAKDFASADELRERIRELGFEVTDTAEGFELAPVGPELDARGSPADVESVLENPPAFGFSVHWLVQGWPHDVMRGLEGFRRHHPDHSL